MEVKYQNSKELTKMVMSFICILTYSDCKYILSAGGKISTSISYNGEVRINCLTISQNLLFLCNENIQNLVL